MVFLPENIRENLKSEFRGLSVAKHSKIEKNWKILGAPVQVIIVFNLLY
jgi:hypothetical protein